MKNVILCLVTGALFLFWTTIVLAAEDSAFKEKASSRQYLGGADEGDLKVQTHLTQTQKNKNETTQDSSEGF